MVPSIPLYLPRARESPGEQQHGSGSGGKRKGPDGSRAAGPESLQSEGAGKSGIDLVQEVRREGVGKEAALLRPGPACWGQGDGLCATCRLGNVQRGLCCKTSQAPLSRPRAIWRFLGPDPDNGGAASTAIPTAGPQRRSPQQRWSQLRDWTPQTWEQVPVARLPHCPLLFARPQADLGLPSCGHRPGPSEAPAAAHQLFLRPGRARAGLCLR